MRLLFLTLLALLLAAPLAVAQPAERPNVLFLFSDDQRADAVGAYGNPYVQTPHIDRLVRTGFSFRSAYVMGSHHGAVCAPSRAMLMSGRSLFHVYDDLDGVPTLPEKLQEVGYATFGTGKWHQSREAFARSFSHGERIFFGGMSDHNRVPVQDLRPDGGFTDVEEDGFSTTIFADAAIRFLDAHAASGDDAPFFAYVSFTAPHDPRTPPARYLRMYPADGMPLPPNYRPVHPFHNGWMTGRDEQLAAWPRTPDVVRAQIGEYYGLVTHVDDEVGRILDALARNGFAENTIIVYASDNGLAVGSHGLLGKQSLYEHSTNVPLIVAGPGIPQGESEALVYLFDLFPTLAGLTGAPIPDGVDGRDLSGVWSGERVGVRPTLYTAYEDLQRAVRDGRWKLIRYPKLDYMQLFDLRNDPYELNNLADDPRYGAQLDELLAQMETWHRSADDPHPLRSAERQSMEFDYTTIERAPDRHQPQEIIDKYFRED